MQDACSRSSTCTSAVLVGHSMGGVAVQSFVTQFPEVAAERVAGIVLLSTLAYTPFGSRSTRTKERIEKITEAHARHRSGSGRRRTSASSLARVGFGERSAARVTSSSCARCCASARPRPALDAPRALIGLDLTPHLPDVRIPTLVIGGTADVLTPPVRGAPHGRLIPGARLEVFAGGGHMLMLERTEAARPLIIDFAREVRARRRRRVARRALTP